MTVMDTILCMEIGIPKSPNNRVTTEEVSKQASVQLLKSGSDVALSPSGVKDEDMSSHVLLWTVPYFASSISLSSRADLECLDV